MSAKVTGAARIGIGAAALAGFAFGVASCVAPAPATGPDAWVGTYERTHTVRRIREGGTVRVTDRLVLEHEPGAGLRFEFLLWFENEQTCAMSGVATARRDFYEWSDTTTTTPCLLRIIRVGDAVHLEDFRDGCKQTGRCGTRGKIDATRLVRRRGT